MPVAYSPALRNARLAQITAQVGADGLLRIYGGTRPAPGASPPSAVLAVLTCGDPFADAPEGGELVANPIEDGTAEASGTATWFRLTTAGGAWAVDGNAGEEAAELILDDAALVAGGTVSVSSLVVTAGNAG